MAVRKPTIFKPKLNQPSDEDRFHEMPADAIIRRAIEASIMKVAA
jgi:hypothetical protein